MIVKSRRSEEFRQKKRRLRRDKRTLSSDSELGRRTINDYLKWREKPTHPSPQPECETTGYSHQVDSNEAGEEEGIAGHRPCGSRSVSPAHSGVERARDAVVEARSDEPDDGVDGGNRKIHGRQSPSQNSTLPPEVHPEHKTGYKI